MKKLPILHPYLFAIYVVLGVFTQQPQEIPVTWIIRPLILILGATFLILTVLRNHLKDDQRAGLITTLLLAWIFSGHLLNALHEAFPSTSTFFADMVLILAWGLLLIFLGSKWLWSRIPSPDLLTNFLNITSWVVILLPIYFVVVFTGQAIKQAIASKSLPPIVDPVNFPQTELSRPDIYVIILDAYGRDDFLQDSFGYDNQAFLDFLKKRGFYIAEQSRANYPQTQLSLSSLLNFNYLNDWAKGLDTTNNRAPLTEALRHSEVRRVLEANGYKTVNIPNSTLISSMQDSDIYLPLNSLPLNQFDGLILSTTTLNIFGQRWDLGISFPGYYNHRQTIQYQLDTLKTIPPVDGPKFVFVHILAPHPPFVFDNNGDPVQDKYPYTLGDGGGYPGSPEEYKDGYTRQLTYLNNQIMETIDVILETSPEPPIIVIQGDHGPGRQFDMLSLDGVSCLRERFSIFNAYYFPNNNYEKLYPSITPVNSFRVIFNTFFDTDLSLLEDRSYYASYGAPYQFEDITGQIEAACPLP